MRDLEIWANIFNKIGSFDYAIGIDERGVPYPSNSDDIFDQFFFLAGVIVELPLGLNNLVLEINHLKNTWFGSANVILHGREMTSKKGIWRKLRNMDIRKLFYQHLGGVLCNLNMNAVVVSVDKRKIWSYKTPVNPYPMAIQAIAERMLLLDEKASRFLFWIEKRGSKEDADLSDAIKNLSALGYVNEHLPKYQTDRLKTREWKCWFSGKKENIALLQVADLIAHYYGRYMREKHLNQKKVEIAWMSKAIEEKLFWVVEI